MSRFEKRQRAQRAAAVAGVDAGKRKHAIAVRPRGGEDSRPVEFSTTRAGFETAVRTILENAPGARPEDILVGIEFAGNYGFTFAHFVRERGFRVVNVLGAHSRRWKEVVHNQGLKSDRKDALTITDMVAQGAFVSFPFLEPVYADLRCLVSMRERLTKLRSATIARTKDVLQVVWPEFEHHFPSFGKKTPLAILHAFPGPEAFLAAPKRRVLRVIREASRGHLGESAYEELRAAARESVALPGAQGVLAQEIRLQLELLAAYERQIAEVDRLMTERLEHAPEAPALLSIPKLGPVTAAVFLGSIGDPRAYDSSRQALKVGGLSLVVSESGMQRGKPRLSKRGRPELRRQAYLFAVRSVRRGGLFRADYERALAANPGTPKKKILVAIARKAVRLMFSLARERRLYSVEPPR